jgi:hypothetical protein
LGALWNQQERQKIVDIQRHGLVQAVQADQAVQTVSGGFNRSNVRSIERFERSAAVERFERLELKP